MLHPVSLVDYVILLNSYLYFSKLCIPFLAIFCFISTTLGIYENKELGLRSKRYILQLFAKYMP